MVPHASVATSTSVEEAMARIDAARKAFPLHDGGCTHGFDVIIIDEKLRHSLPTQLAGIPHTTSSQASTQTAGDDSAQRRLGAASGSVLIQRLVESEPELTRGSERNGRKIRHSLLIGVSARLPQDENKLKKSGADLIWGKPPPEMNEALRNQLLKLLINKRG